MQKGHGLLVGLTHVSSRLYGGWDAREGCEGCALDVRAMRGILEPLGYECRALLTQEATAARIVGALEDLAEGLSAGDILVFHFSGHGAQRRDRDGHEDEVDGLDETLVAYDREIVDDELGAIWPRFQEGVRIVMTSDSCNAATNYRGEVKRGRADRAASRTRLALARASLRARAQLIHLGACRDGEGSVGLEDGGVFTRALVRAWDGGEFRGGYRDLFAKVRRLVRAEVPQQHVQYSELGPVTEAFRKERPFTIG